MKKFALLWILLLAISCLLISACGSGEPAETTAPTATTTAPAVTTTAPAVTTTAPAVTTTVPAVTTTDPAVTTTVPPVTTTVPTVITTGFVATMTPVDTTVPPVTTTPVVVTPVFEGDTVTYDGQGHTVAVGGLPAGATVQYSVNGGAAVSAVTLTDAGEYTVVAHITLPEGYAPVADLTAVYRILPAEVTLAELSLSWIYTGVDGYDAKTDAILVSRGATFAYTMTLTDDSLALLSEYGIRVSYATERKETEGTSPVVGAATERGTYRTVATFTAEGNYVIADDTFEMILNWAICLDEESSWTPIVKA